MSVASAFIGSALGPAVRLLLLLVMLFALFWGLAWGLGGAITAYGRRRARTHWAAIAPAVGLAYVRGSMVGERAGGSVVVSVETEGDRTITDYTVITFTHPNLPADLRLGAERPAAPGVARPADFQTGDAELDRAAAIHGAGAWRMALLSEADRRVVLAALSNDWTLAGQTLRRREALMNPRRIRGLLAEAEAIAALLIERGDDLARLIERATTGPEATRAVALDVLNGRFAAHPETRALAEVLRSHPAPALRLGAARILNDVEVLRALARAPDVAPGLRSAAIAALALHPADPGVIATLAELATAGPEPAIAAATAAALARVPLPDAEAVLTRLLASTDVDVVAAAIESLGAVGSLAAAPALRALAVRPAPLGPAALAAIARIQGRTTDFGVGRLALADASTGELALAPEE